MTERVLDRANKIGRLLASPPPGEEVVISGAAGRFPNSDDFNHFRDNLYNGVDLISDDNRRWDKFHVEIPQRTGKINGINKHDAGFFGVHHRQVQMMEPMCRMVLEHAVEAVLDAGFHPKELEGTRTGVFVGMSWTESENDWFLKKLVPKSLAIPGFLRSMLANRISYHLKLQGPSFVVDTACSSSLYALEHAYRAIRSGECDSAIVAGTNLCLNPYISLQFSRLGVLSPDGRCKSFDEAADGYSRSETIAAIYLQKAKDCRRLYSKIVYAKINCDGYKEEGITFPSKYLQKKLLDEFYFECDVDPCSLTYIEAHGTGTRVGDMVEVNCIDDFFCDGRDRPLLIGTIKSNLGHSEPASGMCSVAKTIIAMENGYIPANLNFRNPRKDCKGLLEGRLKVVTEKTPWPDSGDVLVALSNFGFGGSNAHVLLQRNPKEKKQSTVSSDDTPRLVCASGRNKQAVEAIFDYLQNQRLDFELIRLYHEIFKYDIPQHLCRGYIVLTKSGEIVRSYKDYCQRRPLCFAFADFDGGQKIDEIRNAPLFQESLQKINGAFSKLGVNGGVVGEILKAVSIQLASVDVLKLLGMKADFSVGRSFGVFAAAYCDGRLNLEGAIRCAYSAAQHIDNGAVNNRTVAEIDVAYEKLKTCLPDGIEVVDELPNDGIVVTGDTSLMQSLLNDLSRKGLSFRRHSVQRHCFPKKITGDFKQLCEAFEKYTGEPILSTFLAESLVNVVTTKKLFERIHAYTTILKFGDVNTNGLVCDRIDFVETPLLEVLGKLYESGQNPRLERLYPKVDYPVSRGTPMISPSIKWEHSKDWFTYCHKTLETNKSTEKLVQVSLRDPDWEYLAGHVIDGRNLFPATGYLYLVCHYIAINIGTITFDFRILFEDVKFMRATTVNRESVLELLVTVMESSGHFEITEGNSVVVSGRVSLIPGDTYGEDVNLPAVEGVSAEKSVPLSRKDVYKELRLRGYNYSGLFKSITECDISASRGLISWSDNWVAFMDNMLQMQILQVDTRNLYVPTGIKRLTFDGKKHIALLQQLGENPELPVYVYKDAQIIKSGAVEIRGLTAAPITKRKPAGEPVLEKYRFVPNVLETTLDESVRANVQIILENTNEVKFKSVELFDNGKSDQTNTVGSVIFEVLADQPLIQPDITVLSKKKLEVPNVTVEDKNLSDVTDCLLVVASNVLPDTSMINKILGALKPNGFILSRENVDFDETKPLGDSFEIMTVHVVRNEKLVMFRKCQQNSAVTAVDVGGENFEWLQPLQEALKNNPNIVVYAQNRPLSGLIGFYNCLKREPNGDKTRCFFICSDDAPPFHLNLEFYQRQLKRGFSVNIYKNGQWGTYRHLLLDQLPLVEKEHCYVNVTVRGDLSSLKWIEGPLSTSSLIDPEKTLVSVYYSALNFRDIMTASGRISGDVITKDRTEQDCLQGIEFSGRDQNGRRVMGMVNSNALSTILAADSHMLFEVPDEWSLEEAATVPVVYGTVLYAFFSRGKLKRGQSVLIHAGSGGVGQAAINIALSYGCTVFTTVGTEEKRSFIKKHYPQLTDRNIGNSRDTSFEELVLSETKGRGVDFVLNSLAEDKLQASLRCLAKGGSFLEIGKFDLAANNLIGLQLFEKEASFHGVMLDSLFKAEPSDKALIKKHLTDGIGRGFVKPLIRTVFKGDAIEEAFRFMATGKHIGKVLIKIREEECEKIIKPSAFTMRGVPRYYCDKDYSYIVTGGLGGFGLELADWLVLRGCRKLVLVSRNGIKNGYQNLRIRTWSSYGVSVKISTADITTRSGCRELIREAVEMGPVHGIFNLAVVLKDAAFENQTVDSFIESFGPKVFSTKHLDEASRELCPKLRDFVVFSSVSCGRGNPGQTNYGMANSIMERICERRKEDSLPGLAVEWGAVGEVGLVADMQKEHIELTIGGTLQQKISSCLEVLDVFLKQDEPVVSSMVVAVKRASYNADNMVDCVAHIVGLKDLKTISLHSTLPELGMDSIMAVEIKQTLERDFEVFLTPEDMRGLTFARLHDIQASLETRKDEVRDKPEVLPQGVALLLRFMGNEDTADCPTIRMKSMVDDDDDDRTLPTVFVVAGVEGNYNVFEKFSPLIKARVLCLQLCLTNHKDTAYEMAADLFEQIKFRHDKSKPFTLVAYSFGCLISLELVALLERNGYTGDVIFVDGAPKMLLGLLEQQVNVNDNAEFETGVICGVMSMYTPLEIVLKVRDSIYKCGTFQERINILIKNRPEGTPVSEEFSRQLAIAFVKRLRIVVDFAPTFSELKTSIRLFRPTHQSITNLPDDYGLSEYTRKAVEVQFFEGNHLTVLEHPDLIEEVNKTVSASYSMTENSHDKTGFSVECTLENLSGMKAIKQI